MSDTPNSGGTSSSAACSNGHYFIYAGDPDSIPDGYPCVCGKTKRIRDVPPGTEEVHIYSIDDLFGKNLSGKKIVVHSKRAKEYLDLHPLNGKCIFSTNDPQAAYERKPMLSNDGIHDLMPQNDNIGASVSRSVGGLIIRDHYENLISSGELIRRDELVAWLNEMLLDEKKGEAWDWKSSGGVSSVQKAIDHISKKP